MGGGYFKGIGAEQTFDQGAAQEAPAPGRGAGRREAHRADRLACSRLTPAAPEGQIVSTPRRVVLHQPRSRPRACKVGPEASTCTTSSTKIKDADGRLLDKVIEQTGVLEVTQVLRRSRRSASW